MIRLILLAVVLTLSACSFKWSHPDGSVTYLGVVNVREGRAGDLPLVHSRRYGVMLDAGASNNGLAVGYDDRLLVKPPDDAAMSIDYATGTDPEIQLERY